MTAEIVDIRKENQSISATVDTLRRLRRLTIKELAAASGMDEDTLGRRLRVEGKNGWQATELKTLALALDVDLSVLYAGLPDDLFRGLTGRQSFDLGSMPTDAQAAA